MRVVDTRSPADVVMVSGFVEGQDVRVEVAVNKFHIEARTSLTIPQARALISALFEAINRPVK